MQECTEVGLETVGECCAESKICSFAELVEEEGLPRAQFLVYRVLTRSIKQE